VTIAIAPRIQIIEDEFKRALAVLDDVLNYIEGHKPQPALRVMMLNNTIVALAGC